MRKLPPRGYSINEIAGESPSDRDSIGSGQYVRFHMHDRELVVSLILGVRVDDDAPTDVGLHCAPHFMYYSFTTV